MLVELTQRTKCMNALNKNMKDLHATEKLISHLHLKNVTHSWFKDEIDSIIRNIRLMKSIVFTEELK